eukprot:TRINITY_DN6108_c0_g1_i2.p1 TRINITY_DN6108_c0_g1~~TRINITY_DN6108_c0_g1_i2.p1  ORF type:complete len:471 (+),score=124.22 TRINITY_DN6108_c0_g1_i2:80-1492(+)
MATARWALVCAAVLAGSTVVLSSAADTNVDDAAAAAAEFAVPYESLRVVVLTFTSHSFREVLLNWLVALRRVRPNADGYAVGALDAAGGRWMRERGINVFDAWGSAPLSTSGGALAPLWVRRTRLVAALLDKGVSVVLSDVDAVWVKDPLPQIFGTEFGQEADIAATRGKFPPEISKKLGGAAACLGFTAFRAGDQTAEFVRRGMLVHTEYWGDDQKGLNYALLATGTHWEGDMTYETNEAAAWGFIEDESPRGVAGKAAPSPMHWSTIQDPNKYISPDPGMGPGLRLRVLLLPHRRFQRVCAEDAAGNPDTAVMHCYVPSRYASIHSSTHKLAALQKFRLRLLRTDWEAVSYTKDSGGAQGAEYIRQCDSGSSFGGGGTADATTSSAAAQGSSAQAAAGGSTDMYPGKRVKILNDFKLGGNVVVPGGTVGEVAGPGAQPGMWKVIWESVAFGKKTPIVRMMSANEVADA